MTCRRSGPEEEGLDPSKGAVKTEGKEGEQEMTDADLRASCIVACR